MIFSESTTNERERFVKHVLQRCSFFRRTQVWDASEVKFEGWIENFSGEDERFLAAKILNGFIYYSKSMVNRLLYDAIGNVIADIQHIRGCSEYRFYNKNVYYCYIPGEKPSETDSGHIFLRKLRDALHVSPDRILAPSQLVSLLERGRTETLNLVFCDDFVGSGCQCRVALHETTYSELGGVSIYDFAVANNHVLAYAPIIANGLGYKRITSWLPKLLLRPVHVLGDEYNLFCSTCFCWNHDIGLFKEGIAMICDKCKSLGICDDNKEVSMKGFHGQGLMIGFEHGIPDSDSAIFFYTEKGWTPLMERYYERY